MRHVSSSRHAKFDSYRPRSRSSSPSSAEYWSNEAEEEGDANNSASRHSGSGDEAQEERDCNNAARYDAAAFDVMDPREQNALIAKLRDRNRRHMMKLAVRQSQLLALEYRQMRKKRLSLLDELHQPATSHMPRSRSPSPVRKRQP